MTPYGMLLGLVLCIVEEQFYKSNFNQIENLHAVETLKFVKHIFLDCLFLQIHGVFKLIRDTIKSMKNKPLQTLKILRHQ